MKARADKAKAQAFIQAATGLQLTFVRYEVPGTIEFNVPLIERSYETILKGIVARLGEPTEVRTSFSGGLKAWSWQFTPKRKLVLYHHTGTFGQATPTNSIRLSDEAHSTREYDQ